MELKSVSYFNDGLGQMGSNRTFMELKSLSGLFALYEDEF